MITHHNEWIIITFCSFYHLAHQNLIDGTTLIVLHVLSSFQKELVNECLAAKCMAWQVLQDNSTKSYFPSGYVIKYGIMTNFKTFYEWHFYIELHSVTFPSTFYHRFLGFALPAAESHITLKTTQWTPRIRFQYSYTDQC